MDKLHRYYFEDLEDGMLDVFTKTITDADIMTFAGISGDLVDGRFSEKEAKPIANQNAKLLRVRLGEPFMARQGSMVAYQGNVDFAFEGGGASKFLKKALTGEGLPLMRCTGQGDVFLAEFGYAADEIDSLVADGAVIAHETF